MLNIQANQRANTIDHFNLPTNTMAESQLNQSRITTWHCADSYTYDDIISIHKIVTDPNAGGWAGSPNPNLTNNQYSMMMPPQGGKWIYNQETGARMGVPQWYDPPKKTARWLDKPNGNIKKQPSKWCVRGYKRIYNQETNESRLVAVRKPSYSYNLMRDYFSRFKLNQIY